MGSFPSGVTVVTSWADDQPIGTTVNAFCSVSLTPPMLLICLDVTNFARELIARRGAFAVNILDDSSGALALKFAGYPELERFRDQGYSAEPGGCPQLDAASVFIDCELAESHLAGDHWIMVGRGVRVAHASAQPPLIYHKGAFHPFPVRAS